MNTDPWTDPYLDRVRALYDALHGQGEPTMLIIPGKPHAKMRHRDGEHGAYQDPKDRTAEQVTAGFLRNAHQRQLLTNVCVAAVFVVPDARTRDEDNMMKHVKDSMNGGLIYDDRQVTGEACITELDQDAPRTLLAFGVHESTLDRTVDLQALAKRRIAAAQKRTQKKLEANRAKALPRRR